MAENFTNDVTQVSKLKDIAAYQEHSVVSREIIRTPSGTMTVFAFDKGESLDRLGLILAHEATVPFHIRTQNSRELAFEGLC